MGQVVETDYFASNMPVIRILRKKKPAISIIQSEQFDMPENN